MKNRIERAPLLGPALAAVVWCGGLAAGCAVAFEVDGPTDPPPFSEENPTGFGTPSCVPYTCEYLDRELRKLGSIGVGCGSPSDGCGGPPIDCGSCALGFRCEILSDPAGSRCVEDRTEVRSVEPNEFRIATETVDPDQWCGAHGVECGPVVFASGSEIDCGGCEAGLECGNWPGRCCGPRPDEDVLCVDVSPLPRLYRWCYGQPAAGCVQQLDLIRGTTLGAWCCP